MNEILLYISIGTVLCFAFVNGFHDGGNVIATIICSRSMRPGKALVLASLAEFIGPLLIGTAVAHTMATGILQAHALESLPAAEVYFVIISAAIAAVAWKLPTWYFGLPSSGSHALIGGLVGAGLVSVGTAGMSLEVIVRSVILPMLLSPLLGIVVGYLMFSIIKGLFSRAHRGIGRFFALLQYPTMLVLAAGHGSNDAQKSMGLIAILLAAGHGEMHGLTIPPWAVVSCAAALALGLSSGGWRIVKTVGYGICRMEPVHSFASQVTSLGIVVTASVIGGPVSTTQVISASVMGVGASRRLSGVRWSSAATLAYAWFFTFPVCGALGALFFFCSKKVANLFTVWV